MANSISASDIHDKVTCVAYRESLCGFHGIKVRILGRDCIKESSDLIQISEVAYCSALIPKQSRTQISKGVPQSSIPDTYLADRPGRCGLPT